MKPHLKRKKLEAKEKNDTWFGIPLWISDIHRWILNHPNMLGAKFYDGGFKIEKQKLREVTFLAPSHPGRWGRTPFPVQLPSWCPSHCPNGHTALELFQIQQTKETGMFFQELLKMCHVAFGKQRVLKPKSREKNSHNNIYNYKVKPVIIVLLMRSCRHICCHKLWERQ